MRQIKILKGQPSDDELAAIASACEALHRKAQIQLNLSTSQNTTQSISAWMLSGRQGAAQERSPWQSNASPWQRSTFNSW